MKKSEFLRNIDDLLELAPGTLCGTELLEGVGWDSLAIIGFMALCDDQFAVQASPIEIRECKTPEDLFALVQNASVGLTRQV